MYKRYWRYPIQKGWDYSLSAPMMDHNIFCYGKPGSGKTSKVMAQVLRHAIENERSCVIFQRKSHPVLNELYHVALENGYTVEHLLEDKPGFYPNLGVFVDLVISNKVILFIHPEQMQEPFGKTWCELLISMLTKEENAWHQGQKVHLILDGLEGDFAVQSIWLQSERLVTFMSMDCRFLHKSWRKEQINACIESEIDKGTIDLNPIFRWAVAYSEINYEPDVMYAVKDDVANMTELFSFIDTIACTGVNEISPNQHRTEIAQMAFMLDEVRIGGRYIISEFVDRWEAAKAKNRVETHSSGRGEHTRNGARAVEIIDDIDETSYGCLASAIAPSTWVVEVDGRIMVYFTKEIYGPVVFNSGEEARLWIERNMITQHYEFVFDRQNEHKISYKLEWRDHEGRGHTMRVDAVKVTEKNEIALQNNYLINILEINEMRSRLEQYEERYANQLEGKIFWDRTLIDYFPESFDYFKLFTYISKIDEIDRMREAQEREKKENVLHEISDEYQWKPYYNDKSDTESSETKIEDFMAILPQDGILFLGGHQNMTKKLRQIFPNWSYISDDLFKKWDTIKVKAIFYWYGHSSHKMTQYINSRKNGDIPYLYVTATNMDRLIEEMAQKYSKYRQRSMTHV